MDSLGLIVFFALAIGSIGGPLALAFGLQTVPPDSTGLFVIAGGCFAILSCALSYICVVIGRNCCTHDRDDLGEIVSASEKVNGKTAVVSGGE